MATNEELAIKAQAGDSEALLELWTQNRGLVYTIARRRYRFLESGGSTHGAELDDLMQCGFIGMANAVSQYNPESPFSFNSYLTNHLRLEFNALLGVKTSKRDALNYAQSLDAPLGDDPDAETLESVAADPRDYYEDADERMYCEQRHRAVETVLSTLPEDQEKVMRMYFYDRLSYSKCAAVLDISRDMVRRLVEKAVRELRKPKIRAELESFIDFRTNFFRRGSVARQESPVELNAILRENWRYGGVRV